jgi:AraC-like DNA-binding protein
MLFESEGLSFTEFVRDERLNRAHRMLASARCAGRKIADIAFTCGFGDISYFNRAFRARFGITPSDVRRDAPLEERTGSPDMRAASG